MRRFDSRNRRRDKLSVFSLSGRRYSLQAETKPDFTLLYLRKRCEGSDDSN
nr:MAG TPA: hypothetical protein [Caudoviricetes sp.]